MAVSIVRGPDGRQHEVQHPEGIASSQIVKYAQRQIASSANAEDGFIVDVGKGLFAGGSQAAVSSAAGVTQWMGQSFGSDSLLQAAEDMRQFGQGVGDDIGLDEDFRQSFFGQVVQGLGQVPVTIGAGVAGFAAAGPVGAFGAAAITTGGQMSSEFLGDMEQTLGKGYTDFNSNEKANALTGMLAQTALGTTLEMAAIGKALRPLLKKMGTTGVSSKLLKKAIGKDRSALRELAEAAGAEGLTEAAQGQSLDTLASLLYDEDRELITFDTLKRRTMEFGVGAIVGGTVSGGAQLIGSAPSAPSGGKKADLKKPVQERSEVTIPDSVTVTYKPIDGPVKTVSLAIDPGQDPRAAVEAELAGRYDTTYPMQIDTVSAPVPVGPEQELDLPDQAPDPTQEQVPVQPEASLIDQSNINRPPVVDQDSMPTLTPEEFDRRPNGQPTPEQAPAVEEDSFPVFPEPSVETQPEFDPFADPEPEQAPEARSFSLPQNLKKGKPGYAQTQNITFASDLERASYSATTKTKSDPATRKRQQYRNLLKKSGYSDAEINTMGAEVRAQMKGQYKGKGSPISVSLGQDVAAEASATYMPKRFVGDQAAKAPPFFQSFSPEQYDEGRFVDLETKQDLSNKTFEGGSIRIEGGRPVLETSDNAGETILDSKASEEGPLVRTNLFKQKAGWKWTKAPDGAPSTIVSVEQGPKHYYTLDFSSAKPLTLKTYPSKKSEPRGRPTTRGKVKLGNPVGEISIRGKKHTVYDQVTVGELGVLSEKGAGLTEQEIKDGQEGEQGLVADTPVTGDVVADAAQFKPSRPVSVPNAPVISRSSLRGKSGFIYFSDRTRVGTYTGLNSESGISIPLQGGMGYAFIPKNVEAEAGWAFTSDNIFTRFRDKVNETDGIGFVALYTKENLRANGTFLLAYIAEVNYALQSGKLTKADFKGEVNAMRKRFLAKKVTNRNIRTFISRDVELVFTVE